LFAFWTKLLPVFPPSSLRQRHYSSRVHHPCCFGLSAKAGNWKLEVGSMKQEVGRTWSRKDAAVCAVSGVLLGSWGLEAGWGPRELLPGHGLWHERYREPYPWVCFRMDLECLQRSLW
jgi:hypothetical protein